MVTGLHVNSHITLIITITNLENAMSLSNVEISANESQKSLFPSSEWFCKPSFENFSIFGFGDDVGNLP